jgi:hypothetical protein
MAPSKHKKGESCRLPWLGRKEGKSWNCNTCGARYVFTISQGTDRYGRPIKGHGSWVQVRG